MYIFNMVQHLKSGDVIAPALTYNTANEVKAKKCQEWLAAYANTECDGLSILVTDGSYNRIEREDWVRTAGEE